MDFIPQFNLMRPGGSHFAAALRTFSAGLDAIFHTTDLLAALGASVADLGTDCTNLLMKGRAAYHKVSRCLADLCAVNHETKMIGFDVFSAYCKTMGHRGMQAGFVTVTTRIYARLHVGIVHVIFSRKVMYEAICIQCSLLERKLQT